MPLNVIIAISQCIFFYVYSLKIKTSYFTMKKLKNCTNLAYFRLFVSYYLTINYLQVYDKIWRSLTRRDFKTLYSVITIIYDGLNDNVEMRLQQFRWTFLIWFKLKDNISILVLKRIIFLGYFISLYSCWVLDLLLEVFVCFAVLWLSKTRLQQLYFFGPSQNLLHAQFFLKLEVISF